MPRYYFDIRDSRGICRDDEGIELGCFEDALAQVQCLLPNLASDEAPRGDLSQVSCDVRDETGHVAYRAELTIKGERDPA